MAKRKRPTCNGTSTTHEDYILLLQWLYDHATVRKAGEHRLEYFEAPLPFNRLAAAVFDGHGRSIDRLRSVRTHMLESKTFQGGYCCDWVPLTGRVQNRERLFCERDDQEDVLLALRSIESGAVVEGLIQAHKRHDTENIRNRQSYAVLMTSAMNGGDFEGYRLYRNAVDEIDTAGAPKPETVRAIALHLGAA